MEKVVGNYVSVRKKDIRALMDTVTHWDKFDPLVLSLGIETLLLGTRVLNLLKSNNVETIMELRLFVKDGKNLEKPGFGPSARIEIASAMQWFRIDREEM